MNARTERIHLEVLNSQIPETVESLFHTILYMRSSGKSDYRDECTYSIIPIDTTEHQCDFLHLSYIKANSEEFDRYLQHEVERFMRPLRTNEFIKQADITLTFYEKKEKRWYMFPTECTPWEIWHLDLNIINLPNEHERNAYRHTLGDMIGEKMMYIAELSTRDELYKPKHPNRSELDNIFCTDFLPHFQPYLFKIDHHQTAQGSTVDALRKMLKDALKASAD